MDFIPQWEKARPRLEAFWERQALGRSCYAFSLPRPDAPSHRRMPPADDPAALYMDAERILCGIEEGLIQRLHFGESFPVYWSNFGTAGNAKYAPGCRYQFTPETVWIHPSLDTLADDPCLYDPESPVLAEEIRITDTLCRSTLGRAMVSFPDNCGILDALAALRGTEALLSDLLEETDAVQHALSILRSGFLDSADRFFRVLRENNAGGSVHGWMHTWSPGRHVQLQADFSVMISPAMYREFVLPELEEISAAMDHTVYHLDGREQIRHLDLILSVPGLSGIQWTPVAGQPPTSHFIPELRRIQEAGKCLVLMPHKSEIPLLTRELLPGGVIYNIRGVSDLQEAEEIAAFMERA